MSSDLILLCCCKKLPFRDMLDMLSESLVFVGPLSNVKRLYDLHGPGTSIKKHFSVLTRMFCPFLFILRVAPGDVGYIPQWISNLFSSHGNRSVKCQYNVISHKIIHVHPLATHPTILEAE